MAVKEGRGARGKVISFRGGFDTFFGFWGTGNDSPRDPPRLPVSPSPRLPVSPSPRLP